MDDALKRVFATAQIEWRDATSGDPLTFQGHAAVFGTETTLYAGRYFVYTEQIAPGAFTDVLASKPDVHFNIGHDMNRAVARTGRDGPGGMTLRQDKTGLLVNATLDPADPDVQSLVAKLRSGVMDQMSFAFRVGGEDIVTQIEDEQEIEHHTITSVSDLIDVCVCARGAYTTTDAGLRQRADSRDSELAARHHSIQRPPSGRSQLIRARAHLLKGTR